MRKTNGWLIVFAIFFFVIIGYIVFDYFQKENDVNETCRAWAEIDKSKQSLSKGERDYHEELRPYCEKQLKKNE